MRVRYKHLCGIRTVEWMYVPLAISVHICSGFPSDPRSYSFRQVSIKSLELGAIPAVVMFLGRSGSIVLHHSLSLSLSLSLALSLSLSLSLHYFSGSAGS